MTHKEILEAIVTERESFLNSEWEDRATIEEWVMRIISKCADLGDWILSDDLKCRAFIKIAAISLAAAEAFYRDPIGFPRRYL